MLLNRNGSIGIEEGGLNLVHSPCPAVGLIELVVATDLGKEGKGEKGGDRGK